MKYHFLNSFNLGAGYDDADYIDGNVVRPERELPGELGMDYKNGGCLLVLRSCKDYCYLLVKKILYVNKQKALIQQGRTVNINFSVEASKSELPRLCNICAGILTEWNNFCRRMGDIIQIPSLDKNEYGYSINKQQFDKLFAYMEERGKSAVLPTKIGNALKNHSSEGILLVVPSENKMYYVDNFKAIDPTGKNNRYLLKNWGCVLSASRDANHPLEFEKLTANSYTKDYDAFFRLVSDEIEHESSNIVPNVKMENEESEVNIFDEGFLQNTKQSKDEVSQPKVSANIVDKADEVPAISNTPFAKEPYAVNCKFPTAYMIFTVIIGFILGYIAAKYL